MGLVSRRDLPVVDDPSRAQVALARLGVACLLAACVIGSLTFARRCWLVMSCEVSYRPDLVSALIAGCALGMLWRARFLVPRGWVELLALLPLLYLAGVLARMTTGDSWLWRTPTLALLGLVTALGLLDVRPLAVVANLARLLALVLFVGLAALNLVTASGAMGPWGFPFVALGLAGLLLTFDARRVLAALGAAGGRASPDAPGPVIDGTIAPSLVLPAPGLAPLDPILSEPAERAAR